MISIFRSSEELRDAPASADGVAGTGCAIHPAATMTIAQPGRINLLNKETAFWAQCRQQSNAALLSQFTSAGWQF